MRVARMKVDGLEQSEVGERWNVRSAFFLMSLSCGIEGQAIACFQKPGVHSLSMLHGFNKLTPDIQLMFCVAAVASIPVGGILLEVLAGDRIMRFASEIREHQDDNYRFVTSLSQHTWQRLASLVGGGYSFFDVRHKSISGCSAALAHAHKE